MSALGPYFRCSTSMSGRPGCGRYFEIRDRMNAVDVPEGANVEEYTIGGWQCDACRVSAHLDTRLAAELHRLFPPTIARIDWTRPPLHRFDCALLDGADECACKPPTLLDEADRP